MRTLRVDIEGLDLVLGGGFSLLERVEGAGESATILIRGPAGSGKTVLGTQIAASIARGVDSDVAYGCIEILPTELRAQREGIRARTEKERIIVLPHEASPDADPSQVCIYAGLLDLGDEGQAANRLGEALETLLDVTTKRSSRKVSVVVIDSLSNGYGLGSLAPRILADGISKFAAERGLIVILLEEQSSDEPSVWSFSVDTVFELKPPAAGLPFERQLLVPKNRLGQSDPGPHEFAITRKRGVSIFPRPGAYQRNWRTELLKEEVPTSDAIHPWFPEEFAQIDWLPRFRQSVIAVTGPDSITVQRLAYQLGSRMTEDTEDESSKVFGPELIFRLGSAGKLHTTDNNSNAAKMSLGYSWSTIQSGASTIAFLKRTIQKQYAQKKVPFRVIVGDLRDIRHHADPMEITHSIAILAALLNDLNIPLVLFETKRSTSPAAAATANASVTVTCLGSLLDQKPMQVQIDSRLNTARRTLNSMFPTKAKRPS